MPFAYKDQGYSIFRLFDVDRDNGYHICFQADPKVYK